MKKEQNAKKVPNRSVKAERAVKSLGPVGNLEDHVRPEWWREIFTGIYLKTDADVVGDAHGVASGNELIWSYVMDLRMGNRVLRVSFSDRMLLQADGVLLNRAKVRKFGLELGSVSLFFKKLSTGM